MSVQVPFFRNRTETINISAGQQIFAQGDTFDNAYVIRTGYVDILLDNQPLCTLEAGEIFGEMALINGNTRCATAVATTDCELIAVTPQEFNYLIDNNRRFTLTLMRVLSDRIQINHSR